MVADDLVGIHHVAAALRHLVGPALDADLGRVAEHEVLPLLLHLIGANLHRGIALPLLARHDPATLHAAVAGELHLAEDHPLVHELAERLGMRDVAAVEEHLVPEPAVEQVEHGVLRAAHVEVDRHPGLLDLGVEEAVGVAGVEKAEVIPARPRPLRHRVRLAAIAFAVAFDEQPVGRRPGERRIGRLARLEVGEVRQVHRKFAFVHSADGAGGPPLRIDFVQDRERLAPESLPTEEPVAELVVDRRPAEASLFKIVGHPRDKSPRVEASVGPRRDRHAVAGEEFARREGGAIGRLHHRDHVEAERFGEFKVAVVMRGHRHDRAGAIRGQHIVCHPDGDRLARERMHDVRAGEDPRLLAGQVGAVEVALP